MDIDKRHLLTNHEEDVSFIIQGETIKCRKLGKLGGITIDNKLDFNKHILNM